MDPSDPLSQFEAFISFSYITLLKHALKGCTGHVLVPKALLVHQAVTMIQAESVTTTYNRS